MSNFSVCVGKVEAAPVNWFFERSTSISADGTFQLGSDPLNLLFVRFKANRLSNETILAGNGPVRLLFCKLSLRIFPPLMFTPYHVLTGPVSQLVLVVQPEPLVLSYKATNANES